MKTGVLINFPFPPEDKPEIIEIKELPMKKLRFQFNFYLMKIEMWWSDLWMTKEEKAEIKESLSNRRKKGGCTMWRNYLQDHPKKPSMIGKKNL